MARKYIVLEEAAKILGISEKQLNDMRSDAKISGYRDGSSWKFKEEDIEAARSRMQASAGDATGDLEPDDSILLSEQELGASGETTGSTIIGKDQSEQAADDSDLAISDVGSSDVRLAGDSDVLGGGVGGSDVSLVDSDLSLADDDDLSLTGSDVSMESEAVADAGDSSLDLAAEDDDLVLGESGDSDITLSTGDSGISLAKPADSGISLEEPMELGGSNVESLELGEDDIISLEEDTDLEAATQLKADDDFMLTPMEEVEDASDSGSQVIALDSEEEDYDDSAATMLGGEVPAMSAMLEEDLGGMPGAAGLVSATSPITMQAAAPEKPEYPYSIWNVISLFSCVLVLAFAGMFMFDLVRNMWSWDGTYPLNSSMMDAVLQWFEK